jgi:hypothetical protein
MVEGTTVTGEEYITQQLNGLEVEIALVAESKSNISNGDDIGNLTEPSVSSYSRKSSTLTLVSPTEVANANEVEFNISGESNTMQSFVYLVNYASDHLNESTPSWHILQPGQLDNPVDPTTGTDFVRFLSETASVSVE